MEEILIVCLQFICELLMNFLSAGFDVVSFNDEKDLRKESSSWQLNFYAFAFAGLLGWLSTLIFKHSFLILLHWRILNLFISPILSAYVSQAVTHYRMKTHAHLDPRMHFWRTFWFVLGFVVVRFAYVSHV